MRNVLTMVFILLLATTALAADRHGSVSAGLNVSALLPGQDAMAAVVLDIQKGFHAQSHTPSDENFVKYELELDPNPLLEFGKPVYPPGQVEEYPKLGKLNVYSGRVIVQVPLRLKADATPELIKITGTLHYQICDDERCFFPTDDRFEIATTIVPPGQAVTGQNLEWFSATPAPAAVSFDFLGRQIDLAGDAYLLAFPIAFLVGIIFNLMPCVLPVVPLKAIGFYEVSQHNRRKSLALGAVFSLGLVASFAVLALFVVALQWLKWGELFGNPWFRGGIILVLLLMALSTFGAFAVGLPTAIYRLTPRHDTYTGNFLFGILTAILSTPCTFGMFVGLLAWAVNQPTLIGITLVMTVGVGMAFPYVVLSAFPELARRFPRTGPWAELVKQLMGFLLLGTAIFFAKPFFQRLVSVDVFWWSLFAVVVLAGVYLTARSIQFTTRLRPRLIAGAIALLMIVPAFVGARKLTYHPHDWQPYSDAALAEARSAGRIALVEFTADWCGNCQYVEAFRLNHPAAVKDLKSHGVVMIKADVTTDSAPARPLLNTLNAVGGIPLTAIYSPQRPDPVLLNGIYSVEELQAAIARAAAGQ